MCDVVTLFLVTLSSGLSVAKPTKNETTFCFVGYDIEFKDNNNNKDGPEGRELAHNAVDATASRVAFAFNGNRRGARRCMPIIFGMPCRDIRWWLTVSSPATACRGLASGEASAWERSVQSCAYHLNRNKEGRQIQNLRGYK